MEKRFRAPAMAALAAGILVLSGCGTTKIGRILDNPHRYHNRNVRVQGTVTNSFGAVVAGIYQVDDGTGRLYVLSNRGAPRKGARVRVQGPVTNGVTVAGRPFGTTLRERDVRIR
ncbi:MAG: hypothetical protein ACK5AZ_23165 [Bryobacteraceae bacterium]